MALELIDWLIVASFFVVMLTVGVLVAKRSGKSSAEYFLGGRKMPWWLLGISMVATTFSTDTPNLVTDIVRNHGVSGNWIWFPFLLTGMLTVFVYAKLWRRSGVMTDDQNCQPRWIRGITPEHGVLATHRALNDNRVFPHDKDFFINLAFNFSNYRYSEPWYYGVSNGMALAFMFRQQDNVLLTQSPSGGGPGHPAWDFQWFISQYQVGKKYKFVMRAMYLPYESPEQIKKATAPHRAELNNF